MAPNSNSAAKQLIDPKIGKPVEILAGISCNYNFIKSNSESIRLTISATNDAYIALTYNPSLEPPMYIIKLGLDDNTRSAIDKDEEEVVSTTSPRALLGKGESDNVYWIRWYQGTVAVYREGETKSFLHFVDEDMVPIRYVGLCTKNGTQGNFSVRSAPKRSPIWYPSGNWVYSCDGVIPPEAFVGGHEDGRLCYVSRCFSACGVILGKLIEGNKIASYAYNEDRELTRDIYEVLCNFVGTWVPDNDGDVPPRAVLAGRLRRSHECYVARAKHEGNLITGYVAKKNKACIITYYKEILYIKNYEVLTTMDCK